MLRSVPPFESWLNASSVLAKFIALTARFRKADLAHCDGSRPFFLIYLSTRSLPFSMLSDLFSFLSQLLILFLAFELFAILSQSTLGPAELAEVTISTMSPF